VQFAAGDEQDMPVVGSTTGQGLQRQVPLSQSQKLSPYAHPDPSGPTRPRQVPPSVGMDAGQEHRRAPELSAHVQV